MQESSNSPRITRLSWGRVEAEGQKVFKDAKFYPGGCREWDWNETGTRHAPGIQPSDVKELLDHGAKVVVLSKGVYGRLKICNETLQMLKKRRIPVYTYKTNEAVRLYNELREKEKVGGLFHSTC